MFPVIADRLSLPQIADFWSAELFPADSVLRARRELNILDTLVGAFWSGEIGVDPKNGRLRFLRRLFRLSDSEITFEVTISERPGYRTIKTSQAGSRIRLRVPNGDPDTWTLESCAQSFATLAEHWPRLRGNPDANDAVEPTEPTDGYTILMVEFGLIKLSRDEFLKWAERRAYAPPTFWGKLADKLADPNHPPDSGTHSVGTEVSDAARTASPGSTKPPKDFVHAKRKGRRPDKREKAYWAMRADVEAGKFTAAQLDDMTQDALGEEYVAWRLLG